jgi:PAS domain S-box-containing protein
MSSILLLSILLLAGAILLARTRKRQLYYLRDSHDRLESMNQQLTASEQQLRAANQQLVATEQQLRAANQQLRASEDELRHAHARYQMLFETMPSGVAVYEVIDHGEDFIVRDFNRAGERLEKIDRHSVIGRRLTQVFPRAKQLGLLDIFRKAWQSGEPTFHPASYYDDGRITGWREYYVCKLPNGNVVTIYHDVTEAKQAQIERDRFFNFSRDMLCIAGFDGYFKQLNPSWSRVLGWSNEDILKQPWIEYVHPDDRLSTQQARINLIDGQEVILFENRYRCKDGSWKWISWNTYPLLEEQLILGVARDVTEQKEASLQLAASEQRFRSIVAAMPLGIHMYQLQDNDDLIFSGANPAADRILNLDNSQFIGKTIEAAFPPLTATEIPEAYRRAVKTGIPWHNEHINYQDDKITGAFETNAFQIGPQQMGAIFQDITIRKQSEAAIKSSEARFRSFFEHAPVAYQSLDANGKFLDVNSVWLDTLGYRREDIMGKWFGDLLYPDQHSLFASSFENYKKQGELNGQEFSLRAKNGHYHNVVFYGRVAADTQGNFERSHCVFLDLTEKKKMWDELQRTQRLDSLGILAGGIAHDFNNLLGGIFGYIDLARTLCSHKDEKAAAYLDKAMATFLRAKDLTQQLLTFAKGGKPIRQAHLIAPLVQDAADLATSGSSVRCRCLADNPDLIAEVDAGQITQAISNLVINARQAMPEGGTITVRIGLRSLAAAQIPPLPEGKYITIMVSDTGIGIPQEYLERIFDPFFTTKQQGSGLGLATTYSIIRKHAGHITLDSIVGKGSCFTIYLPLSRQEISQPPPEIRSQPLPSGAGRILVMDDEEAIRNLTRDLLGLSGYDVDSVIDGEKALVSYQQAIQEGKRYDLVILDLTIPGGMGGMEAMARLRTIDPTIKAIVSSGYSDDPILAEAKKLGFKGVAAKPYRAHELAGIVAKVIREN